jgi:long-subunit fatty acid transport protein
VSISTTRLLGRRLKRAGSGAVLMAMLAPSSAAAAGFDTPILYSARHQAMGGTGIAYVNDASAGFHNPAGLQGVQGLGFIADFSLILGQVRSTPADNADGEDNLESNLVKAPFFLVGGAYRVHPWLTLGLAGFPVASGGAEYEYDVKDTHYIDSTEIVFFEVTPMLSLNVPKDALLPGRLALGAGYRVNVVTFERKKGNIDNPGFLDLDLSGKSFSGFRVGLQYQPIEPLKLGVVFRNKVVVTAEAESAKVFRLNASDVSLDFTLPAKLGFGMRADAGAFGVATDVEIAFQSQNERPPLKGLLEGDTMPAKVPNVFDWRDGFTWRFGVEYRVPLGGNSAPKLPLRAGYIFDSAVTNPAYPSAFGTPPAPTRTFTGGVGFVEKYWQANLAVSRRFGSTHIREEDLDTPSCRFCSFAGDYAITMTGLYADVSVDLPL